MAVCKMNEIFHEHIPVLLKETVDAVITSPDGIYVDATFGRGSHSLALLQRLSPAGRIIAFDKDPDAIKYAKQHFANESRLTVLHSSFARMKLALENLGVFGKVSGILFDLGVSSPQLDNPDRGFSFARSGKLDMRMDTSRGISAMSWIATVDEADLASILWKYGEEKFSRRIARAIVSARDLKPITTTGELADIIKSAIPKKLTDKHKHPATRSFQAMRIFINEELTDLESGLEQALAALQKGGRLAVISFHSLEDRIVKQFIRQHEKGIELPRRLPVKQMQHQGPLKHVGKAIKPSTAETELNIRARSAILRIAEKTS